MSQQVVELIINDDNWQHMRVWCHATEEKIGAKIGWHTKGFWEESSELLRRVVGVIVQHDPSRFHPRQSQNSLNEISLKFTHFARE